MEPLTDAPRDPQSATDKPVTITVSCFSVGTSDIKNPEDRFYFFSIQCLFGMTKYMINDIP
jgi:hypothetical protein